MKLSKEPSHEHLTGFYPVRGGSPRGPDRNPVVQHACFYSLKVISPLILTVLQPRQIMVHLMLLRKSMKPTGFSHFGGRRAAVWCVHAAAELRSGDQIPSQEQHDLLRYFLRGRAGLTWARISIFLNVGLVLLKVVAVLLGCRLTRLCFCSLVDRGQV